MLAETLSQLNRSLHSPTTVFWFRRDLRLDDNHGLYLALKSSDSVLPIFIFDTNILCELKDCADSRVTFIHSALENLHRQLLDTGSSLLVLYGKPLELLQQLSSTITVKEVVCNHDYEPYARHRDTEIEKMLGAKGIGFRSCKDQVIFERNEIVKSNGDPYSVFSAYARVWKQSLQQSDTQSYPSFNLRHNFAKYIHGAVPSLETIGFSPSNIVTGPPVLSEEIVSNYDATRNIPSCEGTSRMSVHLRFGTVSIRNLVRRAKMLNEQWLNELIWREFFMMILHHYPHVMTRCFKEKYEAIPWRNNAIDFQAWCEGKTGYPIVDAGMRELNSTAFMHNRVRMIVASFLCKHLLIDWRWGESYFATKLLDYDASANVGNWQWSAGCGCDAAPYFRVFNPSEQARKFDPESIYIKHWLNNADMYERPQIVEHSYARTRALSVYKQALGRFAHS